MKVALNNSPKDARTQDRKHTVYLKYNTLQVDRDLEIRARALTRVMNRRYPGREFTSDRWKFRVVTKDEFDPFIGVNRSNLPGHYVLVLRNDSEYAADRIEIPAASRQELCSHHAVGKGQKGIEESFTTDYISQFDDEVVADPNPIANRTANPEHNWAGRSASSASGNFHPQGNNSYTTAAPWAESRNQATFGQK